MKKIVLLCNGGMSTSMMVTRMRDEAKKLNIECEINAYALTAAKEMASDADAVLVGPQVKHKVAQIKSDIPGVPVEAMNMRDYGVMNGANVLKQALKMMGE